VATLILFDEYIKYQLDGTIDLDTDSFKIALTNTLPVAATDTVFTDITEITAENGYTAGGDALTSVTLEESGAGTGIWVWSFADQTWTASGGSFGPYQYVVIYDDTPTSPADPLVGYADRGSAATTNNGNSFTVDIGANGVIRVQEA